MVVRSLLIPPVGYDWLVDWLIGWLIDWLLFNVPLENIPFIWNASIANEGQQTIQLIIHRLWHLIREGSLSCHTCCATGTRLCSLIWRIWPTSDKKLCKKTLNSNKKTPNVKIVQVYIHSRLTIAANSEIQWRDFVMSYIYVKLIVLIVTIARQLVPNKTKHWPQGFWIFWKKSQIYIRLWHFTYMEIYTGSCPSNGLWVLFYIFSRVAAQDCHKSSSCWREGPPPPSQCPPLPVNCVIFHFIKNNFACYLNLFLVYAILVHKGNTLKIQEYSYYVSVPLIISQHAKPNHLAWYKNILLTWDTYTGM